ncbi:hypothetical protein EZV73_08710 [Acidaminobacter sp. JC074]|uniref:hypothetical protein n=1 Tax=Acidaminobacter sp. JC074 TaxID=2530199 RepID=UPI001F1047AC|nr:hypothetical protein [Acidaminobacter sp. JC074]MCH4887652.1 hypothetical protein [Acidaminobacter sp. JC074]
MNRIYRIYSKEKKDSIAVGYLISEDQSTYVFRVQNELKTFTKEFDKENYRIESIYEQNGESRYQVKTKDKTGKSIVIDLSKPCYGGCG